MKSVLAISSNTTTSRLPTTPTLPVALLMNRLAGVALPPERTCA